MQFGGDRGGNTIGTNAMGDDGGNGEDKSNSGQNKYFGPMEKIIVTPWEGDSDNKGYGGDGITATSGDSQTPP